MIDLPAHADRSSTAFPVGPRLPARLRRRRPLVIPPVVGSLHGTGGS